MPLKSHLNLKMENNQIVEIENYNPDDEKWEFPPETMVNVRQHRFSDGTIELLAINTFLFLFQGVA